MSLIGGGVAFPTATVDNSVLQRPVGGQPFFAPLTLDQVGPAFAATFAGSQSLEVGQTVVHPAFTASYSGPIASATLTDSEGTAPKDVTSSPTAFASDGTFVKGARNTSATFTLNVLSAANVVRNLTAAITWYSRTRWGAAVPPAVGADLAAFVLALGASALRSARTGAISAAPGPTEAFFHAFPSAFGAPSYTLRGGFTGGWSLVAAAIPVVNAYGIAETFDLWRSNVLGLGGAAPPLATVTFDVT